MGRIRVLVLLLLLFGAAGVAPAHEITALAVVADFDASGEYSLELGVDVKLVRDPFGENETPPDDSDAPLTEEEIAEVEKQVAEYLTTSLRFYFDGAPFTPSFRLEREEVEATEPTQPPGLETPDNAPRTRYGASAQGEIPGGAKEFLLEATPEAKSPVVLVIRKNGKPTRRSQVLYSGEFSRAIDIGALEEMLEPESGTVPAARSDAPDGPEKERSGGVSKGIDPGVPESSGGYVARGFAMFLPKGFRPILFVLGLFLLGRKWKPLLWQVAAFTVAHSMALALEVLGVVAIAPVAAGPLIVAAGLVYVGLENMIVAELKWWRPIAVFGIGLVYGFGFATEFGEKGVSFAALAGFNVGIELGQLMVLLIAFAAVYPFRNLANYRGSVVFPASLAIAAAGLYWVVEIIFIRG